MAKGMKIAIVDDEQDMRQSISQWLALSGFDTETFPSAEEALKVVGAEDQATAVARITLFEAARRTLSDTITLLGITPLERM